MEMSSPDELSTVLKNFQLAKNIFRYMALRRYELQFPLCVQYAKKRCFRFFFVVMIEMYHKEKFLQLVVPIE